jgi:hypothetical protein
LTSWFCAIEPPAPSGHKRLLQAYYIDRSIQAGADRAISACLLKGHAMQISGITRTTRLVQEQDAASLAPVRQDEHSGIPASAQASPASLRDLLYIVQNMSDVPDQDKVSLVKTPTEEQDEQAIVEQLLVCFASDQAQLGQRPVVATQASASAIDTRQPMSQVLARYASAGRLA